MVLSKCRPYATLQFQQLYDRIVYQVSRWCCASAFMNGAVQALSSMNSWFRSTLMTKISKNKVAAAATTEPAGTTQPSGGGRGRGRGRGRGGVEKKRKQEKVTGDAAEDAEKKPKKDQTQKDAILEALVNMQDDNEDDQDVEEND